MPTSHIRRIRHWGLGIACMIGLSACGTAEPPAAVPGQAASQAATIAPSQVPTALPAPIPTAESPAAALATAIPTVPATQPPAATSQETTMPDQKPTQPPARPTLQVAATLVPEGTVPALAGAPPDPALVSTAQVDVARADLARRRSVALDTIRLVDVQSVTWPDPGLGCPQPGIAYKQVPVDGLLIRLESAGQLFEYHSGGSKAPFLCEQATGGDKAKLTPVSGGEGT